MMRLSSIPAALILCLLCAPIALAQAAESEPGAQQVPAKEGVESLGELLQRVRSGWRAERREAEWRHVGRLARLAPAAHLHSRRSVG